MNKSASELSAVQFEQAYYIKLGAGGKWEESSIGKHKIRIGWSGVSVELINNNDWQTIETNIRSRARTLGAGTNDLNALKSFCKSTPKDIWITFYNSSLWWCRVEKDEKILSDEISKYRGLSLNWTNESKGGKKLLLSDIPGSLSQIQGFRGTLCKIREQDTLRRLINDEESRVCKSCNQARKELERHLVDAIQQLQWKDFETLVDLVFRQAGWRRISVLGETMKFADLDLEEPITGDRYQVQIKSRATKDEFEKYVSYFSSQKSSSSSYRRFYFVVHTPEKSLKSVASEHKREDVELILPEQPASMVVDGGLTEWLMKKIR